MQVTTSKETLWINQVIGQKIDTVMCEEDFVVPDIKPDILNTIRTSGTVCIYKRSYGWKSKNRWLCKCIYNVSSR